MDYMWMVGVQSSFARKEADIEYEEVYSNLAPYCPYMNRRTLILMQKIGVKFRSVLSCQPMNEREVRLQHVRALCYVMCVLKAPKGCFVKASNRDILFIML